MKTLTKQDVLDIAANQVQTKGETTTLEIKQEARSKGFKANQSDVSGLVSELVSEDLLGVITNNGIYRVYCIGPNYIAPVAIQVATADPSASAPVVVVKPSTPSTPNYKVKHQDGTITPVKALTENLTKSGDWEVSSTENDTKLWFLGQLTRDEVRSAYRKALNVPFTTTRTKHIK